MRPSAASVTLLLVLVAAGGSRAFGAERLSAPARHEAHENPPSAKLPRGVHAYLEIADEQPINHPLTATAVLRNSASVPTTLLDPTAFTWLVLQDANGRRLDYPGVPEEAIPQRHASTVTLAPDEELRIPLIIDRIFAPAEKRKVVIENGVARMTPPTVESRSVIDLAPGTYDVSLVTMLADPALPQEKSGRILRSANVTVRYGSTR